VESIECVYNRSATHGVPRHAHEDDMANPPTNSDGSEVLERFRAPAFIRKELTEFVLGTGGKVWTRDGLEPRDRSLGTICVLTALGRRDPLREHIGMGLDNGLTAREICEALMQCAVYAGFPSCVEAMQVAADVFEERGIEG
jgi:4-carboxymuconolactone decarboxylase